MKSKTLFALLIEISGMLFVGVFYLTHILAFSILGWCLFSVGLWMFGNEVVNKREKSAIKAQDDSAVQPEDQQNNSDTQ